MTEEQRLYLGDRAKEVLENEAFSGAMEQIEKDIIEQWTTSPARDAAGRESLWTYLCLLRKLKANLQTTLETGKLARIELEHKRTMRERLRDALSD